MEHSVEKTYGHAATIAGVGWLTHQSVIADYLMEATKRLAKALRRRIHGLTHSRALEAIARCSGFAHWHAMQACLKRTSNDGMVPLGQPQELAKSLRLIIQTLDVAPEPVQRVELEGLAAELAVQLKVDVEVALDAVAEAYRAESWAALNSRDPLEAPGPMYGFQVYEGHSGVFVPSAVASRLEEEYWAFEERGEDREIDWRVPLASARTAVKRRPDYLFGYYAIGRCLEEMDRTSRTVVAKGVRAMLSMVTEAGVDELAWGSVTNRFAHRLMYLLMEQSRDTYPPDAVALAEWQMALNWSDNNGIRMLYAQLRSEAANWKGGGRSALGRFAKPPRMKAHVRARMFFLFLGHEVDGGIWFALEHLLDLLWEAPKFIDLLKMVALERDFDDESDSEQDFQAYASAWKEASKGDEGNASEVESAVHWALDGRPELLDAAIKIAESEEFAELRRRAAMGAVTSELMSKTTQRLKEAIRHEGK